MFHPLSVWMSLWFGSNRKAQDVVKVVRERWERVKSAVWNWIKCWLLLTFCEPEVERLRDDLLKVAPEPLASMLRTGCVGQLMSKEIPWAAAAAAQDSDARCRQKTKKDHHHWGFSALPSSLWCIPHWLTRTKSQPGYINHSMTHLTHRPSASGLVIRINAGSSYEASDSNGWRFNKWLLKVNLLWHITSIPKKTSERERERIQARRPKLTEGCPVRLGTKRERNMRMLETIRWRSIIDVMWAHFLQQKH